jgi:hypothetical protein
MIGSTSGAFLMLLAAGHKDCAVDLVDDRFCKLAQPEESCMDRHIKYWRRLKVSTGCYNHYNIYLNAIQLSMARKVG